MNDKWKRWMELSALFLFCAATFLAVEEHFIACAVCFAAGAMILSVSRKLRKNDGDAAQSKDKTE